MQIGYGFFWVLRTPIKHLQYLRCGTFKREVTRNKFSFFDLDVLDLDVLDVLDLVFFVLDVLVLDFLDDIIII